MGYVTRHRVQDFERIDHVARLGVGERVIISWTSEDGI
jgi:hypothetical protein